MNQKRKAALIANLSAALIVLIVVVFTSPLFGFGLGISAPKQYDPAAATQQTVTENPVTQPTSAPKPTPRPTPAPVVLPSPPPIPDPTPRPTPNTATRPQNDYAPRVELPEDDYYYEPEEDYREEDGETEEPGETEESGGLGGIPDDQQGGASTAVNPPDEGGNTGGSTDSGDTGGDTGSDTGYGDTGADTGGDTGGGDTGGDSGIGGLPTGDGVSVAETTGGGNDAPPQGDSNEGESFVIQ